MNLPFTKSKNSKKMQNKTILLLIVLFPFLTVIILAVIMGGVLVSPLFLVGYLYTEHKKKKRRSAILDLLNKATPPLEG
jgi:hypothetical protein